MTSEAHALLTAIGIVVIGRRDTVLRKVLVLYEEVLLCQYTDRRLDIGLPVPEENFGIWTVAVND